MKVRVKCHKCGKTGHMDMNKEELAEHKEMIRAGVKVICSSCHSMEPGHMDESPKNTKANHRDHRTVLVGYRCSRCASFVRERIDRDYIEDFRLAVMAKTIKCGCG